MEVKDRKDIDVKDTWNLESIYANNELWEEDYAALEKDAAEFAKLKGAIEVRSRQFSMLTMDCIAV